MARNGRPGSVGTVETRMATIALPAGGLQLESGGSLPELQVAYETYGTLAPNRDNVVVICHALSGDAHVAGYHADSDDKPGWWDEMVGPGKGIDTDRMFVICSNILGGCKGTTGPASINPQTGRPYGSSFPSYTIGDMVNVQRLLLQHLGIEQVAAVIGGSLGGMQVLEWGIRFPAMVKRCICIASAVSLSAQALAFDIVGRSAIVSDPNWQGGDYYGSGRTADVGLAQARMIGHITYLSPEIMTKKFGREKQETELAPASRFGTEFQVESYLRYQGSKFVDRFDANSYLHITHAMDAYDLIEKHGSLQAAFRDVQARFLVVALSSDWLFPPEQSLEIASGLLAAGKRVSYCLLQAPHGHDAFLVEIAHLAEAVRSFLASADVPDEPPEQISAAHGDYGLIEQIVAPGSRVLDLGCGDGELLALLTKRRQVSGLGMDIDLRRAINAMGRGIDVLQGDIDEGLPLIPPKSYDYVILSETLQVVRKPRLVLNEMLRIADRGIVTFPNFANWSHRLQLGLLGRMPKSGSLPFNWYDTPNIHLATLKDFVDLCRQDGIRITRLVGISGGAINRLFLALGMNNLGADRVVVEVTRA